MSGIHDDLVETVNRFSDNPVGDVGRFKYYRNADLNISRIRNILLVSSAYDYFLLEEEGRLSSLFKKVYGNRGLGYVPQIFHTADMVTAHEIIKKQSFQLIVLFNPRMNDEIIKIVDIARRVNQNIRIVVLMNNTPELNNFALSEYVSNIDGFFTWHGDGNIFLSIVNLQEDHMASVFLGKQMTSRVILLVEDSVNFYCFCHPLINHLPPSKLYSLPLITYPSIFGFFPFTNSMIALSSTILISFTLTATFPIISP